MRALRVLRVRTFSMRASTAANPRNTHLACVGCDNLCRLEAAAPLAHAPFAPLRRLGTATAEAHRHCRGAPPLLRGGAPPRRDGQCAGQYHDGQYHDA
eukprot:2225334-Prymnesium_polylepis.1